MTPEQFESTLLALRRSVPFRPFTVELTDGTALRIDDAKGLACRGGTAVFVDRKGVPTLFDHERVASITPQSNGAEGRARGGPESQAECSIPDGTIYNRGRGPEIKGTRITVYDVMDYYKHGWQRAQIAGLFRLPPHWIQAALDYIEEHREEVQREYQKILDRHHNYEYPPEVKAKIAQNHEKLQRLRAELRARRAQQSGDGNNAGTDVRP
ncbi:MAG TPA: DUF433 domain-containing protein [Planctomycetaceae bacterium]|nr:DUF433 domain-containing protein [Planctomycetaceae bacterium]